MNRTARRAAALLALAVRVVAAAAARAQGRPSLNVYFQSTLKDPAYQDKMANALLMGIRRYLAQNPPLARTKIAQNP